MRISVQLLGIGHIRYNRSKVPRLHRNNFFHIAFVLEGSGYVILNGHMHEVTQGDVHIYHPSWSHDIWPKAGADLSLLDLRFTVHDAPGRKALEALPPFLRHDTHSIFHFLRQIETTVRTKDTYLWQDLAHAYLIETLADILNRTSTIETSHVDDPLLGIVSGAIQLMYDSLPRGISVSEVAEKTHVNPTHLANLYRRYLGASPGSYMTGLKLDHFVRTMIMEEGTPVYVLRRRYGWKDERHFRELFKRRFGSTPSEFAKKGRSVAISDKTKEHWLIFDSSYPMRWYHDN